ncbi:MAG: LytR C-terminal domain-containing protein [Thermoleophilia bacterium]|nr:LytR C-terminal domain-containing protein [Thermoleophilia bacterium]
MDLVDLLTPSLAAFAAIVAVGLGIQAFRQGRQIRRLEQRLGDMGVAGTSAPLERLAQLQKRMTTSSGAGGRAGDTGRRAATAIAALAVVALVAFGAWWFLLRGDSSGGTTPTTDAVATPTGTTGATTAAAPTANPCAAATALANPADATVTLFNASGVTGAALQRTWPKLQSAGYSQGSITDSPDGRTDLAKSVVMFVKASDRNAACAVAKELKIKRVLRLDGFDETQIGPGTVNVVVMVGLDLANA